MAFSGCDYNDEFDGLDELSKPTNVMSFDYTVTDADIATIVKALKAAGTEEATAAAKILEADKMFSKSVSAEELIPVVLTQKYPALDVKSSANVTYKYKDQKNETAARLTGDAYILGNDDYKSVWGDVFVNSFTPEKPAKDYVSNILEEGIQSPREGDYVNVEYFYSKEEPISSIVEGETISLEGFEEGQTVNSSIKIDGWLNAKVKGNRTWDAKSFSGNTYAQMSSNGSKEVNDIWLIAAKNDLTKADSPHLIFQVKVGYYNADCLSILVSEDFDGNEANITSAKWDDITDKFEIPKEPTGGYGEFVSSGLGSLVKYKGKNVYIAFRYQGDDTSSPKKTTTYQLDDIKVCEAVIGLEVEEKNPVYAAYTYSGEAWKEAGSNVIVLQPEDYAAMGLNYLSAAQAPNYLPVWLKSKYPYAQNGDSKIIAYKTNSSGKYNAEEVAYNGTAWTITSVNIQKTDQFVVSNKGWVFDPTITIVMPKADYQVLVDYVSVNQGVENPALVHGNKNAEYYYGFSSYYGNVSYRDTDRSKDPLYKELVDKAASNREKSAFMNERTAEGIAIYLSVKYPDATTEVAGIEQLADVTVLVYYDPDSDIQNVNWTYTMKCTGNKQWEFVQRESQSGEVFETF